MRIVISGASGLIGTALKTHLTQAGHTVTLLVRDKTPSTGRIPWNPYAGPQEPVCDARSLDGCEAFLHLSGENVAGARWTPAQKQRLRDSRVITTRNLVRVLAEVKPAAKTLLCASAIGYYGERGDEMLTEQSHLGTGFLPELCSQWEQEAQAASALGIRVVNLRFGLVLSREGGPLAKMLLPFKLGIGGRLASGRQYMSWIAIQDAVRAVVHALTDEKLRGPVNITAPEPVTNREFTKTLGRALHRPTIFPVPGFALKLLLGEMAEALLAGARVVPARLLEAGFSFQYPTLQRALEGNL